ncbi:HlyD family efflux transporter periplasmic adaptor subunit [Paraclostridium sordellii]|uniref:HlyD family efflux transporter periplasmic adaptor subunit n=1 Tax=Paraclostridium sordellii TaxID=1505 RepID=UPI0005E479E4|nr:HlyD family efflux transporter periplasmic adaptor subunit [Paeniclostridium sordellii]CEP98524.1 bacteriocin ABC transporter bacteriocin-binding protein [[Clostridium] sordellii] [Paeniclostridium sordellii]
MKNLDESSNIKKDSNRTTILAQIEEKINLNKQSKTELEANKKQIEDSLSKCVVKAPVNGKINTLVELQQEILLQPGTIVANVIPNSDNYKIDLMIPTKDIANINNDKKIKYSFEAFSYREYGFLEGKIASISSDSKVDSKTGMSFFTGEGNLNSNVLHINKGEASYVKPEMICEAKTYI